jgi:type III pantothenate kinase
MNLVIDIGNNYFKFAVFRNNSLISNASAKNNQFEKHLIKLLSIHTDIEFALISNVSDLSLSSARSIFKEKNIKFFEFESTLKLPFSVNYKSKDTLGNDRLALIAACVKSYPNSNNLIIDAGTCITADFISETNTYLGGLISPGIEMRYKSLNKYTARLPKLKKTDSFKFPANSTSGSIHTGVVGGVINEILGFIEQLQKKYKNVNVILTGGDAKFLSKTLKITIFANQIFILEGLNSILNLNK